MSVVFVDQNLDLGPYLLTCLFERAWCEITELSNWSEVKSNEFKASLRVLEWLGLVEPDSSNPLGFKPTHVLVSLVMARETQLQIIERPPTHREECALDCVLIAALGFERDRRAVDDWIHKVLHALGLVVFCHEDEDNEVEHGEEKVVVGIGDWAPTRQLLLLAAVRADKDHNRWWMRFLEL
jgi:hypothetical protein